MPIRRTLDVPIELLERFRHCGAVSVYLVSVLPDDVWRAATTHRARGRTVADIVAHMLSLRRTFARMGGAREGLPALDRRTLTRPQAERAFIASTDVLATQFEAAITDGRTRVKGMPRRLVDMLLYLVQHDAHHRGQITMLAHDLGHRLTGQDTTRIWGWSKLPPRSSRRP